MDRSLVVSAGIAVAGAVLALLFLPGVEGRKVERPSTAGRDVVRST
jgi:hypothetical protein